MHIHLQFLAPSFRKTGKLLRIFQTQLLRMKVRLWMFDFVVPICPIVGYSMRCKFYFCSFDLCGQSEPREDDKSNPTSVSQRLRDNPAVCHLNSFRGGGSSPARRAKQRIGRLKQRQESRKRNGRLTYNCNIKSAYGHLIENIAASSNDWAKCSSRAESSWQPDLVMVKVWL